MLRIVEVTYAGQTFYICLLSFSLIIEMSQLQSMYTDLTTALHARLPFLIKINEQIAITVNLSKANMITFRDNKIRIYFDDMLLLIFEEDNGKLGYALFTKYRDGS